MTRDAKGIHQKIIRQRDHYTDGWSRIEYFDAALMGGLWGIVITLAIVWMVS